MATRKQILAKERQLTEKYLNNPNVCPFCDSESITADHGDFDDKVAYRDVTCTACGKTWTEGFVLDQATFDEEDIKSEIN